MRALYSVALLCLIAINYANSSEDVELKDPYLVQVAEFAANKLLEDPEFELGNVSLHRIMDAQFAAQAAPAPSLYLLTLELGADCSDGNCKSDVFHICEVTVMDEPWVKKRTLSDDKSRCTVREPNGPLKFLGDSVATSVPIDGTDIANLVPNTIVQMEAKTGGKHTLRKVEQARKVMMQETKSILYYLTLNISTAGDSSSTNEICEVTMEEMLEEKEQILRSLHCFTAGDEDEPDQTATRIHHEELAPDVARSAVLASLAVIDAESVSKFQLKVIGYSVADSQVSVDSGTRDIRLKIGVVPSLCIKRPDSNDEEETVIKSCPVDSERDPSVCSITLTQWPWVTDGYLFSDLSCDLSNHSVIADTLEPYTDEGAQAGGEAGLEVEEVNSNTVQASNRESTDDDEEEEVEEEVFVARRAPCVGCPVEIDGNSEEVRNLATSSLSTLEAALNSEKAQTLVRVVKATSQVVSGIKYELTLELADTNCQRAENLDRSQCLVDNDGEQRTCTVSIWDQPWINSRKFLDPDCQSSSSVEARALLRTGTPGGSVRISPTDDSVKEMAVFALDHLDSFDDNNMKRVLVKVLDASYQVVAGKLYNLKIQMALSDCPETKDSEDTACQLKNSFPVYICDVSVLSQPWTEEPKRLVDSKCSPASGIKETRDAEFEQAAALQSPENPPFPLGILPPVAVGGISPANTQNQYIKEIAKFATIAVNENFNEANSVKLVRVVDAKTQIVDGTNVFLDVEVGNS